MKYLLNRRSFIFLMVLFSFFDNFGMKIEEDKYDYLFKVLFVGDAGVGKMQIINNILGNKFSNVYSPSIGVNYMSKSISFRGKNIKLQLFDTPGQERFRSITQAYYEYPNLIVFVYAVNDKKTFGNIQGWVNDVKNNVKKNPIFLLVGNKIDLNREVTKGEGEALAKQEGIAFFEVSAKTGDGIKDMFYNSVVDLLMLNGCILTKEDLVKELLQKKENGNGIEADSKNTERSSLCSMCIDCCKNCFNSDEENKNLYIKK